jgi:hypothetical protein
MTVDSPQVADYLATASALRPAADRASNQEKSNMKIRARLELFASVLLIAGCAAPAGAPGGGHGMKALATPCNEGICKAKVTVVDCAKGYVPVTDDPIEVPDSQTGSQNILWTIETRGYRFPTDGIVVDSPGFTGGVVPGSGKMFLLTDAATLGYHKYTVTVVRESDGTRCKANDPFILNR